MKRNKCGKYESFGERHRGDSESKNMLTASTAVESSVRPVWLRNSDHAPIVSPVTLTCILHVGIGCQTSH